MAIKREDLTDEQKAALVKLYIKFRMKNVIAVLLYLGFLFFANFVVVLFNELYLHNPQFQFLLFVGNTVIVFAGVRGTLEEQRYALVENVEKIVGVSIGDIE